MARLRRNFITGRLAAGITAASTTISSAELATLPVIAAPDYMALVLDPKGEAGAPEVVYVTAHTANSTTATITRAQEGTTARTHPLNARWINGITAGELDNVLTSDGGTMTGTLNLVAGTATTIPLISKGASGQTANLQEWQNSSGTVLARVSSAGQLFEGANRVFSAGNANLGSGVPAALTFGNTAAQGNATTYAAHNHVHAMPATPVTSLAAGAGVSVSAATGAVTVTNTGVTSAVAGTGIGVSASSGAVTFTNSGVTSAVAGSNITVSAATGAVTIGVNANPSFTSGIFTSAASATIPLIARGVSGQSANLQEWRNSGNTVLGRVNATGDALFNSITAQEYPVVSTANLGAGVVNSYARVATSSITAQYGDVQAEVMFFQQGDGIGYQSYAKVVYRVKQQSAFGADPQVDIIYVDGKFLKPSDFVVVVTSNAGPTVADFFMKIPAQYQGYKLYTKVTSANGTITWINNEALTTTLPAGTAYTGQPLRTVTYGSGDPATNANLTLRARAVTDVPLYVQGMASQSGNLTEWRNSANSTVAYVNPSGGLFATGISSLNGSLTLGGTGNASIEIGRADGVASTPHVDFHSGATYTDYDARLIASGGDGTNGGGFLNFSGAGLNVAGLRAGQVPFFVKGASSQTADLQQWQNSAGTVLARVDNNGNFYVGSTQLGATPTNVVTTDSAQTISAIKTFTAIPVVPDSSFGISKLTATGTRDGTTFLRGDGTWAVPPGSGGAPANMVTTDSAQTISAIKTFTAIPVVPDASFDVAKISATGTRDGTTYLRGDGTWAAIASAGTPANMATTDTAQTISAVKTFTAIPVVPDASFGIAKISATGTAGATTYLRGDGSWSTVAAPSNMATTDTAQTFSGIKTFSAEPVVSRTNPSWRMTDGTNVGRIAVASSAGSYASGSAIGDVILRGDANTQRVVLSAGPSSTTFVVANGTTTNNGSFVAVSNAATTVPGVIKGAASQTGDLQQWQDSAGNILARVANDGTIYKGATAIGGGSGNAADTEIMAIMGAF